MRLGLDLATEWRSRRWRRLLAIIDGLPRHCAYMEAVANDEALGEQLAARPEPSGTPRRRMSEYSAEVEVLTNIEDRITELINVVIATRTGKSGTIVRAPRPVTAVERVRRRHREHDHNALVAKLLPHKGTREQQ